MLHQFKNINFYIVFFIDILLFCLSLVFAYLIRFEFMLTPVLVNEIIYLLPMVIAIKSASFFFMQLYKGMFRYAGLADLWRLVKAVSLSTLVLIAAMLMINRFHGFSRAVFLIDGALTLLFVGAFRLAIRYFFNQYMTYEIGSKGLSLFKNQPARIRVLIYGAGNAGEKLYREIAVNQRMKYEVVGFGDDDPHKWGRSIHGISVLGGKESICAFKDKYNIQEMFIAMPSSTGRQMRDILAECRVCAMPYKTVPGMGELVDGKVKIQALREVRYKDLLRRKSVDLDTKKIAGYLREKVVLVTGAGGSIGSELCRQIIQFHPRQLILLDASEPGLYRVQMEIRHRAEHQRCAAVLGLVQDEALVDKVMRRYEPQVIFHAAAYKHVPMLERNPWQAVSNNIRGNQVMLEKAMAYGVSHYVLVSSDKAVRPTNIMGASKRICELMVQAHAGLSDTWMMSVRFGNVVGSSGSVIPLFQDQIKRGGPVTVTHPEVTRYFMIISEAAQLILQAGAQGQGGEIFILEMGEPIKIADMARDLIRLSGKEPDEDIEVRFTGLRQGEKLYEELISSGENVVPTMHDKIMVLKHNGDWNGCGTKEVFQKHLMAQLNALYTVAAQHDICAIREKMQAIVPEFDVQDSRCVL
jgi:FlaA1/EpsC-like NDP-sugar epimerase